MNVYYIIFNRNVSCFVVLYHPFVTNPIVHY